nr:hypothetical protein CKG001_10540 [Bdellovibrio sp. CKG001]
MKNEYRVRVNYKVPESDTFQIFADDEDDAQNQALNMVDDEDAEVESVNLIQEGTDEQYVDPNQLAMDLG